MSASQGGGLIHFRHYFHPAGHGTFFTGHIKCVDDSPSDDFVWVYDCGSRKWSQMDNLIALFAARLTPKNFIDMVCLSHFDSDHVNGIEALLSSAKVGALVLPYLSLEARLALASQLSGNEPSAHRLAAMIVDPSRYLAERGLRERVERIIMVQGGQSPDSEGSAPPNDEPNPSDNSRNGESCAPGIRVSVRRLEADEIGHQQQAWLEVARHDQAWTIGGLYELVFYNRALPNEEAPKSGASLSDVAAEVADIVTRHGLCTAAAPVAGWVQALKSLYGRHFGSSSKNRNGISLCVLGRPIVKGTIKPCRKFAGIFTHPCDRIPWFEDHPQAAVLLTGDITLDLSELSALQKHVGTARWNDVGVMQVPHHGSVHSWQAGLSAACVHHHSVICAAPSAPHPHADVVHDLKARTPIMATYAKAVAFDYHVNLGT
jgi:hypothetical protein